MPCNRMNFNTFVPAHIPEFDERLIQFSRRKGVKGDYKSTVYYMRRYGTETTCLLCNYGELHWHLYV